MKKIHSISFIFCSIPVLLFAKKIEDRPNILFILSDDHSYPYLSCSGNPDVQTPNIDRLAQEGIQYHRAYTSAPQSVPSRTTLMTGRNVLDVRMSRFSAPLQREYTAFPEVLRQNGYYTGVCGRSYHLDGSESKADATVQIFKKYHLQTFQDRMDFVRVAQDADETMDQFKEFLDEAPADKPFFVQVNFHDPHWPWTAKAYNPDPEKIQIPAGMPDIKELRQTLAAHYGEIMRLDAYVGKVMEELQERKIRNTVVVFMGDNGSAVLRGKGTLYDAGLHVPLIIKWEGKIPNESDSYALISGEDLAPTLLDIGKSEIPEEMTGKSFAKTFSCPESYIRDYVYAVRVAHGSGLPTGTNSFDLSRTVFSNEYKLIYNVLWQLPYIPVDFAGSPLWKKLKEDNARHVLAEPFKTLFFPDTRKMFELYDLKNDPFELHNLSGNSAYQQVEQDLKTLLQEWMIVYQDYCPLPIPPGKKNH